MYIFSSNLKSVERLAWYQANNKPKSKLRSYLKSKSSSSEKCPYCNKKLA